MIKNELIEKLDDVYNIYEFVITLYDCISQTGYEEFKRQYEKNIRILQDDMFKKLNILITSLDIDDVEIFDQWKKAWIELIKEHEYDINSVSFYTLREIDKNIGEIDDIDTIIDRGPKSVRGDYFFYYKSPKGIIDKYIENENLHRYRQTIEYDTGTYNKEFNNFSVLNKSGLQGYVPKIILYNPKVDLPKVLKIGFGSLGNRNWFKLERDYEEKSLGIVYDVISVQEHCHRIENILEEFEEKKMNVVVFPELSISENVLRHIKGYVQKRRFRFLKLIFLGSYFSNDSNKAIIINDKGQILMEQSKRIAYELYDKTISGYLSEKISNNESIYFLDVKGIGRIAYLICAEYNSKIKDLCHEIKARIIVVSAFTNSTYLMEKSAVYDAETRGIVTILSNSCAAITEHNTVDCISFITGPKAQNKHLQVEYFNKCFPCTEKNEKVCTICTQVGEINYTIEKK